MTFPLSSAPSLFQMGFNTAEIAHKCSRPESVVYNIINRDRERIRKLKSDRKRPAKSRRHIWTDDDIAILATLASNGLTAQQIARRLKTTKNSVIGKCQREGISLGRRGYIHWTADKVAKLEDMAARGCSAREMSRHFNKSKRAIEAQLWQRKIKIAKVAA